MSKQKQWKVSWSIDIEDEEVNTPVEAVEDCWRRLQAHGNDWVWEIVDIQENKTYEVDCDVIEGAEPVVTEIIKEVGNDKTDR